MPQTAEFINQFLAWSKRSPAKDPCATHDIKRKTLELFFGAPLRGLNTGAIFRGKPKGYFGRGAKRLTLKLDEG